jgi:hypothetical protein
LDISIVSLPPLGIASRALIARFRIAVSSWLTIGADPPDACAEHRLHLDALAQGLAEEVRDVADQRGSG